MQAMPVSDIQGKDCENQDQSEENMIDEANRKHLNIWVEDGGGGGGQGGVNLRKFSNNVKNR